MNDEELQQRLRRLDRVDRASVDPVNGARATSLLEHIMSTSNPTTDSPADGPARTRRWPKFVLAGGTAAALVAVGVFAFGGSDGGNTPQKTATFAMQAPSPIGSSCINLDGYEPPVGLAGFKGTVTSVTDGVVTLKVTKWFAGGDADTVMVTAPANVPNPILEGGVEFAVGSDYLVAVLDGEVQAHCGISGADDPALAAYFVKWFAA